MRLPAVGPSGSRHSGTGYRPRSHGERGYRPPNQGAGVIEPTVVQTRCTSFCGQQTGYDSDPGPVPRLCCDTRPTQPSYSIARIATPADDAQSCVTLRCALRCRTDWSIPGRTCTGTRTRWITPDTGLGNSHQVRRNEAASALSGVALSSLHWRSLGARDGESRWRGRRVRTDWPAFSSSHLG